MKTAIGVFISLLLLSAPSLAAEFKGSPCTKDCSGHKAGYAWAEKKGITDPDDCRGRSESFVKGCRLYAQEQRDEDDNAGEEEPAED